MKKITTKKTKTVNAPAATPVAAPVREAVIVKPVQTAPVKPVQIAPVQAAPAKVAPVQVAPVQVAPAKVAPVKVAPVQVAPVKKPAVKTTRTTIVAKIDVGFGNALYIRGEGPGLSWDKGLAMDCVADNEWTVTISDALAPVLFKLLLNDITWCAGNDYSVEPGGSATIEPTF